MFVIKVMITTWGNLLGHSVRTTIIALIIFVLERKKERNEETRIHLFLLFVLFWFLFFIFYLTFFFLFFRN